MTEKEIEKLFKEKLENRDFEFNPENWKAMEAMLDRKNRAGAFYWRSAAAILLFGAIVASLIYFNPSGNTGIENTLPITHKTPAEEQPHPQKPAQAEENTASRSHGQNPNSPEYSAPSGSSESEPQLGGTDEGVAMKPTGSKKAGESEGEGKNQAVHIAAREEEVIENENPKGESEMAYFEDEELLKVPPKGYLPLQISPIPNRKNMPVSNFSGEALRKFYKANSFILNAGMVMNGSNTNNDLGIGWVAGLGYQLRFAQRWTLTTSLNYSVQNKVGILDKTDSVFFNFGKEVIHTEVKTQRLEYLEVPLNLAFDITPKHQLGAEVYLAVLVNMKQEVERKHLVFKQNPEVTVEENTGYQPEFNRYDYGIGAFYRYTISPGLSVGLHMRYGLADITEDISGSHKEQHQNVNTRIVLRYNLF